MVHGRIGQNVGKNDFTGSVKRYYNDLKGLNPIPREEEYELMKRAKAGDVDARNRILNANLKFVFEIATQYRGRGVDMADLISEGNQGMLKAMEKFDMSKNVKFYSYAVWWIRQKMQEAVESKMKSMETESDFDESFCSDIHHDESGFELSDDSEQFIELRRDILDDSEGFGEESLDNRQNVVVTKLLDVLNDRERFVITKYFGINSEGVSQTIDEISKQMNLTSERVRQIKMSAINEMRAEAFNINEAEFLF